jgi:hypothetical protein
VEVYRPQQACEVLQKPILLTGESVLRKFSVSLDFLWL